MSNRLGEFREFREIRESRQRTGITPNGHPAGTLGAIGVERLRPPEIALGSNGGERGQTDWIFRRDRPVWCHTKRKGPLVEIGPRSVFAKSAVGVRQ